MTTDINSNLKDIVSNTVSFYILIISILFYVIILPHIDYDLLQLINSLPVKLLFTMIIIYTSTVSPTISIVVMLIYMLTIQQYNNTKNIEGFTDIINKLYKNVSKMFDKEDEKQFKKDESRKNIEPPVQDNAINNRIDNLCNCPEVKNRPKFINDKDPRDTTDYNIDKWDIFQPIVPVNN